jgi:class 3 adenylate cyclase/tetratricopeptide (TPR) repeat protein
MTELPTGTVTFLFTDIEGSATLWEHNPAAMKASLARHHAILRRAIEGHGGRVFQIVGDSFQTAFAVAANGLAAAVAAQRALSAEAWGETGPLRVRMGLHVGPAETSGDDYVSSHTLNRVSRVMSAGHGGQILLSLAAAELAREQLPGEVSLRDLGEYRLKGLSHAERIFQAVAPDLPADFSPLNALKVQPSVLDRLARGRLVARERELAEAVASWQRATADAGQVLLISGEPGIGKTRLVRELAAVLEASGGRVLQGDCYAEGGAPYAPVAQIIQTAVDLTGLEDLSGLVLADLITLAPALRARFPDAPPNPSLDPQVEQQRIFESVVALCAALTARTAPLLFVDDAHWADSGTLALIRHLARRAHHLRLKLLIVLTYRETELDEARALNEVLLDLNRERLATRIKLTRLSRDETRDLLAALFAEDITPEFLDGIYHETEGNPFFVEEVCKALVESGKLVFNDGRWRRPSMAELEIPQSVRVAIQSRVGKLPEAAQETLRLAAIFGREFRYDALAKASELDEEALIAALEGAERAQLIGEVSGARDVAFAFVHALIPATLVEGVGVLRRRRLHRRAAEAIEALRPDDSAALARHFAAAGERGKAVDYSHRAAQQATALYAYDAARQHLITALDVLDAGDRHATRLALLEDLADVHRELGEFDEAVQAYQEALEEWRSLPDADRIVAARLHRKIVDLGAGAQFADFQRFEAVFRASAEAGRQLAEDAQPHPEFVRLLAALSYNAWLRHVPRDWDTVERYARTAVDMAERLNAPVELSAALEALNVAYGARGLFRERVQASLQRLALSRDPSFGDAHEWVSILIDAGRSLAHVGEYAEGMQHLLEAENLAGRIHSVRQQVLALNYQARIWFRRDRWDRVLAIEPRLRELEQRSPNFLNRAGAYCFLIATIAGAHALRGDVERAAALRDEAMNIMVAASGPPERWDRSNRY